MDWIESKRYGCWSTRGDLRNNIFGEHFPQKRKIEKGKIIGKAAEVSPDVQMINLPLPKDPPVPKSAGNFSEDLGLHRQENPLCTGFQAIRDPTDEAPAKWSNTKSSQERQNQYLSHQDE
eukprot:GHVN01063021.1.p1 GENE.GHVN01063021.1~~GHVN01063021.1.p1  ORF type:complete len:120 (+),score=5.33 GHVN01063021.1:16-375(+)